MKLKANRLTDQQHQVLVFIRLFTRRYGYPPTRAEIAKGFGFASPNAAQSHLMALQRKGHIHIVPGASRGITLHKGKRRGMRTTGIRGWWEPIQKTTHQFE